MEAKDLRKFTKKTLLKYGISIPDSLPLLEDLSIRKSIEEIIDRCLILNVIIAVAAGFDSKQGFLWLEKNNLSRKLGELEKEILSGKNKNMTKLRTKIFPMAEAVQELFWSIGLKSKKAYLSQCDEDLAEILPNLKNENKADFINKINSKLENMDELKKELDIYYCLHRYYINQEKDDINSGYLYRIYWRRYALERILSNSSRENVVMDT